MKYPSLLFFIVFLAFAPSCGDSTTGRAASSTDESGTVTDGGTPATPPSSATYPSIPLERLEYLWENATYSDMTFYYLPISTNQSEQNQIRASLTYVAEQVPIIDPACKPIARVWYQENGKNIEEAEVYFSEGCTFYLWYEEGKPKYANQMTQQGVNFFNKIISSVPPEALQQR